MIDFNDNDWITWSSIWGFIFVDKSTTDKIYVWDGKSSREIRDTHCHSFFYLPHSPDVRITK